MWVSFCLRVQTEGARFSHLTVPPLTVLFMLSRRRSLASLRLQRSSSSMRVSRLSVSLQSSFTAPTFSMKIRSFERWRASVRKMLGRRCHIWCPPRTKSTPAAMWKVHLAFVELPNLVNDQQVGDGLSVGAHHIPSLFHRLRQDLLNLLGNNSCRRTEHVQRSPFSLPVKLNTK